MSHDNTFILVAQLSIFATLFFVAFIDARHEKKPLILGRRRAVGWVIYYALFAGWFAAMFGAFSKYFGVPDGLAWGYFGAAILVQAILQRSRGTASAEAR